MNHVLEEFFVYVFFALLIGASFTLLADKFHNLPLKIPHSIIWFLFGLIIITPLHKDFDDPEKHNLLSAGIIRMSHVPANVIYMILLPILLYEGAVNANWHVFTRNLKTSIIMAYPGVIISAALFGVLFKFTFEIFRRDSSWSSWIQAFLIGSICASTDPVAVISVLRSVGAPVRFVSIFEGESLLNDGTSVMLFIIFDTFAKKIQLSVMGYIWFFFKHIFVPPILGLTWGYLATTVALILNGSKFFQVIFLIANVYLNFFVTEHYIKVSGPLSVVCFGLFICRNHRAYFSSEFVDIHLDILKTLAAFSECLIFTISGTVSGRILLAVGWSGFYNGIIIYIYANIVRAIMITCCYPLFAKGVYGFSYKQSILLIVGGLRGAIVLALILVIDKSAHFKGEPASIAGSYVSLFVILMLGINGTLFNVIYNLLNPFPVLTYKRSHLTNVFRQIDEDFEDVAENFKIDQKWMTRLCVIDIHKYSLELIPKFKDRVLNKYCDINRDVPALSKTIRDMYKNIEEDELLNISVVSVIESPSTEINLPDVLRQELSGQFNIADFKEVKSIKHEFHQISAPPSRKFSHRDSIMRAYQLDSANSINEIYKQRLTEIYLMIGYALRRYYLASYDKSLIAGGELGNLLQPLDLAEDFALAIRKQRDGLYQTVCAALPQYHQKLLQRQYKMQIHEIGQRFCSIESAFELEFESLLGNLSIHTTKGVVLKTLKRFLNKRIYEHYHIPMILSDVSVILTYLYAHYDILNQGGAVLIKAIQGQMFISYKSQTKKAQRYLKTLSEQNPVAVCLVILRYITLELILIKEQIINKFNNIGYVTDNDKTMLLNLLNKQRIVLLNWHNFYPEMLTYIKKAICFKKN